MLSNIQKKIILRAVQIRINNGENIDDILNSYPKLTDDEKKEIKVNFALS